VIEIIAMFGLTFVVLIFVVCLLGVYNERDKK